MVTYGGDPEEVPEVPPSGTSTTTKTAKPKPPSSSGTSGGSGNTYRRNGPYIQMYRLIFGGNVKPNMALINKAVSGNWSSAYFKMQVRLNDKNYFKSQEAKARAAEFKQYWKAIFPDADVNKSLMRNYLRHSWSQQQLQDRVMQTNLFKREYKHYNAFANAQREAGQAKIVDPLAYRKYLDTFQDAYRQAGMTVPTGFEKAYFKSGVSEDEFRQNFLFTNQSAGAAAWDISPLSKAQQKNVLFSGKGSDRLRAQLQQALNKQANYFKKPGDSFGVQQKSELITMKGI